MVTQRKAIIVVLFLFLLVGASLSHAHQRPTIAVVPAVERVTLVQRASVKQPARAPQRMLSVGEREIFIGQAQARVGGRSLGEAVRLLREATAYRLQALGLRLQGDQLNASRKNLGAMFKTEAAQRRLFPGVSHFVVGVGHQINGGVRVGADRAHSWASSAVARSGNALKALGDRLSNSL